MDRLEFLCVCPGIKSSCFFWRFAIVTEIGVDGHEVLSPLVA